MRDRFETICAVIAVIIIGVTVAACDIGNRDGAIDGCPAPTRPPPAPYLVPATLDELHEDMTAVISVDQAAGIAISLNIPFDISRFEMETVNPPQCPKLSAIATLNGDVMRTSDPAPTKITNYCAPIEWECTPPTFTLPASFDATAPSLHFSFIDSSGVFDIDVGMPAVSLDGSNVLIARQTVSATLSPAGIVPTQVVIGAPETGAVFFDVTPDVIPKTSGFSFVMPTIDYFTASSESLPNSDFDAGVSSCGAVGATLPCNAALEVTFDPIFNRCDFGTCDVEPPASQGGSASGASSGAASGTVFVSVLLASNASSSADDAGVSDASASGD